MLLCIAGANAAVKTVGYTEAINGTSLNARVLSNGGLENLTISDPVFGSAITDQGSKTVYIDNTSYTNNKSWRKSVKESYDNQNVGYKLTVGAGYKMNISSVNARIAVADDTYTWYVEILNSVGTQVWKSSERTTTKASSDKIDNVDVSNKDALQGLTGTITVNLWVKQGGSTKYFSINYLQVGVELEEDDRTNYTITASVADGQSAFGSIDKAGDNSVPEGENISLTAIANKGYAFTYWTKNNSQVSTDATLAVSNVTADATYVANFKKLYKVTYNLATYAGTLTGKVLCNYDAANGINEIYADANDKYTIPSYAHRYLYREGYILSGWTDGANTYNTGDAITLTSDITLTPTWKETIQTLATSNAETTVTWSFAKAQIVFMDWQSNDKFGYYTKPLTVNNELIAVPMKIQNGKVANYTRTDELAQANQNTTFTIPAVKGMKVKIADAYKEFTATTIAGSTEYTGSGTKTIEYTYNGTDETIDIVIGEGQYLKTIAVTYPAIEQRQPSDLSLILPGESVTLTADNPTLQLNPTSSATVALTYKSDNPLIATVDEKGLITAVANGTTVITVSQKGDAVYQDDSKTVTVTVNNGVTPSYSVEMILNNETGSILTSEEQVQGTQVSFGVNAANERVEADADDAVVTVSGKYWNDHGFSGVTLTVKATGNMKFTIGNCTYNKKKATITNANNEEVASASLAGTGCWKGTHTDVTTMYYEGEATTLTFSNPSYCPYLKVESVGELHKNIVTFRAVEGAVIVAEKMVIAGESVGKLPTAPAVEGKQFIGWYTATDGTGDFAMTSTVPTADITYYANYVNLNVENGYVVVDNSGTDRRNGENLLGALAYANANASANNPVKIFLKNGTYDLGDDAETTQITGSYVSLIGESLDGTIITNVPTQEGLGTATLLYNKGQYNYLQDLTLWNNYPYGNSTGRAASLKDEGNYTICNNVWLYSHQDTYYSHSSGAFFYFKGGKISGCVDYMCGQSRVYYDGVTLSNDNRGTTMTANSELYVFNNCVIENGGSDYNFGRAWSSVNNGPVCVFLNTTLKDNGSKLAKTRWNPDGLNVDYAIAGEYGTMNASGTDIITPLSNSVTFKKNNTTLETILTANQAATYTMEYTLGDWAATAASDVVQATVSSVTLSGSTLAWESDAEAFLIEKDGAFVALTADKSYDVSNFGTGLYTVRAANSRGGFGEATQVAGAGTLTWNIATGTSATSLTSTQVSTIDGITADDMTAIQADAADAAGKANLSVKLNCGTVETAAATVTFTVPDGYAFIPYSASAKVQPISKDAYVKVALGDVASEAASFTQGQITEATLTEDGTRELTGTVTVGIYCYDGAQTGVTTYRLSTPVTVTGQLVELAAQTVTATVSSAGWATLYTDKALDFSQVEGLTAYTATVSENTVTLTKVTEIGSVAGVVLQGKAGTYDIPVLATEPNTAKGSLTGDATDATAWNKYANNQQTIYILAPVNDGKDVQFVPCTSGSIAAKKAFLVLDTPANTAKAMQVVFASEATGISNVNVSIPVPVKRIQNGQFIIEKNGKTYNAAGQLK